jgi:hypothetical protein
MNAASTSSPARPQCLFCGKPERVDIFEIWSSHEFMLEACCEGLTWTVKLGFRLTSRLPSSLMVRNGWLDDGPLVIEREESGRSPTQVVQALNHRPERWRATQPMSLLPKTGSSLNPPMAANSRKHVKRIVHTDNRTVFAMSRVANSVMGLVGRRLH